jgi:glycosyltransferase involved in cell wall biosynthesis
MKILHHERKRLASHFSIERLFAEIRRQMPADCEVVSCPAPEASAGILPRWRNVRHAARQTADVHHIVGDSHYLAFGLPREKTVLTIHDCGALNRLTGLKRALLKYFWFTGPMRRAAVVTTISQASKDELRKWVGPLADKVVVVPDCVFEEFAYDPKPFNEECPVVLQVGTKWNKNVERVMEAVEGTGCRLEIVGTISADRHTADGLRHEEGVLVGRCFGVSEETRHEKEWPRKGARVATEEDLRLTDLKLKTTTGSEPAVCELGRLSDDELVEAYRRCDMVVFASLYEGFGLPILEAQAMGRPVITSNFGAMREAAGDGALLVDPYSVEAIREAVLRVKREPALREDLIAKGLRNAANCSADAVAMKYAQIYRNLATD